MNSYKGKKNNNEKLYFYSFNSFTRVKMNSFRWLNIAWHESTAIVNADSTDWQNSTIDILGDGEGDYMEREGKKKEKK